MLILRLCSPVLLFLGLLAGAWLTRAEEPQQKAQAKPPWQRLLQGDDAKRAADLGKRINELEQQDKYAEAVAAARELLALRMKVQGADHWGTVNARQMVATLQHVATRPEEERRDYQRMLALRQQAQIHESKGHYREAQPLLEQILTAFRKLLGEEHPLTALSYNNLAANQHAQGRYAPAEEGFRKALDIRRKLLGEEHPSTATSYDNLAYTQYAQGKYAQADEDFRKALDIKRKVLGEEHPNTARSYNNLALNQEAQGKYAPAEEGFRKALDIRRKLLGEEHPDTASSYGSLALNQEAQGKYTQAEEGHRKALDICRKALGEEHPDTARSYNNLAVNQNVQGRYAQAGEGYRKALDIYRKALGEEHPKAALCYDNLAHNLNAQGKYAQAEEGHRKTLDIRRKALGEDHPHTAHSYSNLANNQNAQGKYAQAEEGHRKALDIRRKVLGEDHPHTATSYDNLALSQQGQGRYAQAEEGQRKALDIYRKVLGEEHPDTATSYNNLAYTQYAQGRYAQAEEGYRKALDIRRKALGEEHPDTAISYNNLALFLNAQGRYAQAEDNLILGANYFLRQRVRVASAGIERATKTAEQSPLLPLAALLARNGKPALAWQRLEEGLGRSTWDEMSARAKRSPQDQTRLDQLQARLERLDRLLEQGAAPGKPAAEVEQRRKELLTQRRQAQEELDQLHRHLEKTHGVAEGASYPLEQIQKSLPADTAFLAWIDIKGEAKAHDPNGDHWAVLVRARGTPVWVRLRGKGPEHAWTEADSTLPRSLYQALTAPPGSARADWGPLARRLAEQRLDPLRKHLAAGDDLPAVRQLIVLPSTALDGVPVELLVEGVTVSYASSATLFTHLRQQARPKTQGLLALGDPVFDLPKADLKLAPLPERGLLLTTVLPGANAAQAGLKPNDVLLAYNGVRLEKPGDFKPVADGPDAPKAVRVEVWRDGKTFSELRPGKLGVVLADDPAPEALKKQRQFDQKLLAGTRSGDWQQLPGTRVEVEALQKLFASAKQTARLLTDAEASEQKLLELAQGGELSKVRYLHLATHGEFHDRLFLLSAVILSRDALPDPGKQLLDNKPIFDGRLTAQEVLQHWKLDAELVTLSACQSGLGKYERGEGFMGFAQAILLSGSRSVCLSLWKVDDTATALLMERFYQNLLGQRDGLKQPMKKAAALAEAKAWLRDLTQEEAVQRAAALTKGVARGKGRPAQPLLPEVPATKDKQEKPFAHPYYWAAFVLIGDPD